MLSLSTSSVVKPLPEVWYDVEGSDISNEGDGVSVMLPSGADEVTEFA